MRQSMADYCKHMHQATDEKTRQQESCTIHHTGKDLLTRLSDRSAENYVHT